MFCDLREVSVLWIRDILVDPDPPIRTTDLRNRMQILFFSSVTDKMPKKLLFLKVYGLLLFEGYLRQSSIIKKTSKRSHKILEINVFYFFLLVEGRILIWIREAQNIRTLRSGSTTLKSSIKLIREEASKNDI